MKTNVPIKKQRVEPSTQPPGIQRRINAGWLRLWRTVYPNVPPPAEIRSPKCEPRGAKYEVRAAETVPQQGEGSRFRVQGSRFKVQGFSPRRPAAVDYLASLLCTWLALALLATGCAGPRPLKGGRGVTTRNPAGAIEQTLVQGENPSQASKQDQESVKLRTYTVPAGSRVEQPQSPATSPAQLSTINSKTTNLQPSTLNAQPPSS